MILRRLRLESFRSYEEGQFDFSPQVNVICGDNGRGKTNLLEGIWLLTGMKSWRSPRKADWIQWDKPLAKLKAGLEARGREFEVILQLPAGGRTGSWVNGVRQQKQQDLSQYFRCVLFSPEDLSLIKGPAAGRRAFLDQGISQMRPRYQTLLEEYESTLANKSRLLREEQRPTELLDAYDQYLARTGALLLGFRARFCRGLAEECGKAHQAVSCGKETLSLRYLTVKTVTDPFAPPEVIQGQLLEHLESHRPAELQSGSCLSGLHRDEIELCINDRPARAFASQGQSRSAALALKFGLRELFFRDCGEYPVLLLDDVLSELDESRRAFVVSQALGGQTIITACKEEGLFERANRIGI